MPDTFDPYHKWLGIRPRDQPPNHYRLLGVEPFEHDPDVIEAAADQRMAHMRTYQTGQHSALSQRLLNELSTAKVCLLNAGTKTTYDQELRSKLGATAKTPAAAAPAKRLVTAKPIDAMPSPVIAPATSNPTAVVVVDKSTSHRRRSSKPWWQQTTIVAVAGVTAALLAVVVYVVKTGSHEPRAKIDKPSGAQHQTDARPAPRNDKPRGANKPAASKQDGERTSSTSSPEQNGEAPTAATSVAAAPPPLTQPGESIDLLKRIDLSRDIVEGEWQFEDGTLIVPKSHRARLQVPYTPPAEYRLEMVVEREEGRDGLLAGLIVGGRQTLAAIDGWDGHCSGIDLLDGKGCQDNESTRRGRVMPDGKPCTLVFLVHSDSIKVTCDGLPLIDWHGDVERLSLQEEWAVPNRNFLFLADYQVSMRISKMTLTPLGASSGLPAASEGVASSNATDARTPQANKLPPKSAADDPVDLLALIDPRRDLVAGEWTRDAAALVSPKYLGAKIEIPFDAPEEYQMTVVAEPLDQPNTLVLGQRSGGHRFQIVINYIQNEGPPVSALENIEAKNVGNNTTTVRRTVFEKNRKSEIVCTLRKVAFELLVDVVVDDQKLTTWRGRPEQLSVGDYWKTHHVVLYVGSYDCRYRIHSITLGAFRREAVIWNWELNTSDLRVTRPDGTLATVRVKPLDARRWYTLRYMVTREATTIWVDGEEVFSEKRDNPEFTPAPISVYSATGSIVDVKRFVVKPLE